MTTEARQTALMTAVAKSNVAAVITYIQADSGLDKQAALMSAVRYDDMPMVQTLLRLGADPLKAQANSYTPMMQASWLGHTRMLRLFLDLGADINQQDEQGYTVLMRVADNGSDDGKQKRYIDALRLLLAEGAALDLKNNQQKTALEMAEAKAEKKADNELIRLALRKAAATRNLAAPFNAASASGTLMSAILRSDVAGIESLIRHGADANQKTDFETTMSAAARSWKLESIKALIENGAAVDLKDSAGNTALNYACLHDIGLEMARYLADKGADINGRTNQQQTPLMWAAASGAVGAMDFLLRRGAKKDLQDENGSTAIMMAVLNDRAAAAAFLIDCGADANIRNNDGKTPLEVAEEQNKSAVAAALTTALAAAEARNAALLEAKVAAQNRALHKTAAGRQRALKTQAPKIRLTPPGGPAA